MNLTNEHLTEQEVPADLQKQNGMNNSINMNEIVGSHDILFVCLDTLRYDVAMREQNANTTPNLNKYGSWEKRQAPGTFTYPSHHSMFAGFLPSHFEDRSIFEREILFFPKSIGLSNKTPQNSFAFDGATFVQGLEKVGYETYCIGGVAFFNKRTALCNVFPSMFQHSYWNPSFGCSTPTSFENQINFAIKKLRSAKKDQRVFFYINVSAIHYPNYYYVPTTKHDSIETHAAALQYVDTHIEMLFSAFKERNKTFVIACSDHGTCYGEDGIQFHGVHHEIVNTVPYKHFVL